MEKKKINRCSQCKYLNFDFISGTIEHTDLYFCGLHGRVRVVPDAEQIDLDHRGSCGFFPKKNEIAVQLSFDF